MKKMIRLMFVAAAASLLAACAQSATSKSVTQIKSIKDDSHAEMIAVGPTQMVVLGPVFYIQDSKQCSKLDLLMAASKKYANMSDVINIEMEETHDQRGMVHNYSCKYYGLAVAYAPLTKETVENIKLLKSETIVPQASQQAPVGYSSDANASANDNSSSYGVFQ